MEQLVGKRMYRGLLKSVARVWNPIDIQDLEMQQKVWPTCKRPNEDYVGPKPHEKGLVWPAFAGVLGSLRLSSLGQVDNLKTLQEIVVALEAAAPRAK